MKTAAWFGLIAACVLTTQAQAQSIPDVESYTVYTYAPTGSTGGGTMAFVEGGIFAYDSDAEGTLTGNFLETDSNGEPAVYVMYLNGSDQVRFIYGLKTTVSVSVLPISLIYGIGFGADEFYVFGGYSFDLTSLIDLGDLGSLPF